MVSSGGDLVAGLDQTQVDLLDKDQCILIDNDDVVVGVASKKECHLLKNIECGMLHRAFSVFLFNTKGELLLQQRADAKITYPGHWTNTCCSHPLNCEEEVKMVDAIGVKNAAQRKLLHELGIQYDQVEPAKDLHYLTRIHYKASNVPYDGKFGEHEIDYILFMQKDVGDFTVNDNEVQNTMYISKEALKKFIETAEAEGRLITPWFKLIAEKFLFTWWDNLNDLKSQRDWDKIHRML